MSSPLGVEVNKSRPQLRSSDVRQCAKRVSGAPSWRNCEKGPHKQVKFKKKKRRPKLILCPLLRPAGSQVPRAPENSTQFIMDNHENSNLFFNFDSSKNRAEEENEYSNPTATNLYAINDFEDAYRSAHEENLMSCDIDDLKCAIINLESQRATLQQTIKSRPSVLLDNLQNMLIDLQKENKRLRQENTQLLNPEDGLGSGTSDSDSSFSSVSDSE